jgi:hypothetical protein
MQVEDIKGMSGCFSIPVLAAGTTTTITTTNAIDYAIRGKGYTSAALTNQATPTTDINTGAAFVGVKKGFGSVFVYGLNAAGTLKCAQGSVATLDTSSSTYAWGEQYPQFPTLPADFSPFGYLTILAGSTADATTGWVQGSSNQASVTGITYARHDVALGMPDRPQTS